MVKKTKFGKATKRNRKALKDRCNYISDPTHPNHVGKTIFTARNYRCDDNSPEAFEKKAIQLFAKYDTHRKGKQGNRTRKLFEEHIYSSAPNAHLTDKEKRLVEKAIMENGFPFVSARTAWHDDPETGRSDLHILSAGYTDDIPPQVHLSTDFGHGKRDFLLTLERAERDALDIINRNREPSRRIISAREAKRKNMKEAKVQTLAEKLSGLWDGSKHTIKNVLEELGYTVTKLTKKSVSVLSPDQQKTQGSKPLRPRRYTLETLIDNLESAQPEITQPSEPSGPEKPKEKSKQSEPPQPAMRKKRKQKDPSDPQL